MAELRVASDRTHMRNVTGVLVRAQLPDDDPDHPSKWVNADIAQLDAASLASWLRSRGGENEWAESVVALLLGHPR